MASSSEQDPLSATVTRPTVLAVDDTPSNLLALEAVLGKEFNVVRANSGPEALDVLKSRNDIDLILMDVQMPKLDGFETATRIKQMEFCCDIPIVFVTAVFREDPWVQKGYKVGGIDYFSKPFDPDLLRMKVGIYATLKQRASFLKEGARQRRLSEKLLETAGKLSSTFETSATGLIIADVHGNVQQINDEVFRIFRTEKQADDEVNRGTDSLEGNKRFICDQLRDVLRAAGSGRVPHREIVKVRCGDGSEKSILCSVSTLRQMASAPIAIAIAIQDITESRRIVGDIERDVTTLISGAGVPDLHEQR